MNIPLERAFPLEIALSFLTSDLSQLGLTVVNKTVGQLVQSTKCTLLGDDAKAVDFGYGKGTGKSCLTGAAFEAAEHYFSQPQHIDASTLEYLKATDFLENTPLKVTRALEALAGTSETLLPFRRYRGLTMPQEVLYPLALACPKFIDALHDDPSSFKHDKFDYKSLQRYSTNSGVAIGSTEEEAIIHGLLEAIERDTLSRFLVSKFIFPNQSKIRLVETSTLPEDIQQTFKDVSSEVGGKVILVEMQNDLGIPVFLSSLTDSPFPIDVAGFGASLSRDHAALRSLYELVQCFHVTTEFHPESVQVRDNQVLKNLSRHSFHLRCAEMKLAEHCRKYGLENVAFDETPDHDCAGTVPEYLENLLCIFAKCGVSAYSTKIVSLPSGITVTHSFIDGQDHFFCVTEGSLVFPNEIPADCAVLHT